MKFSQRDLAVAAAAATLTASIFALAQAASTPAIIGASTYAWNSLKPSKTPVGEVRQVLKGPTATLEQLELHITTLNPGQSSHLPHHHANEELVLLSQGTVETLSNGQWKRLGPGSVILNGSESSHSLRNVGPDPAQYFVVNWRTPATDAIAAKNPPDGPSAPNAAPN